MTSESRPAAPGQEPRKPADRGWRARLRDGIRGHPHALAAVALAVLGTASCGAGAAVAAWTNACAGGCPTAAEIDNFAPRQASGVYDSEGNLLGMFYRERRQLIELSSLPPRVYLAFVAIEDRRFFTHDGVDPRRMAAAVRDNIIGGWGGPGGSTITMQLARNLFPQQLPMQEKSLRRKVGEIRLALEMERRFGKAEILQLYLNHIYLGSGAYGIEAASRTYFDKPASELSIPEAAMIAGLPQAPSRYDPLRHPEAAERRRNRVLSAMAEMELISDAEAARAQREPLNLTPPARALNAPYFVEHVRRELDDQLGELLYTGGLKIYTTLDPALQTEAEAALGEHLAKIEQGHYGYYTHISYEKFTEEREGEERPITNTPYLQGLVAALNPANGDVLALVGGRDYRHSQFNRATQARRQPGSAFKPFVYAAGLEQGRSPMYSLSDSPVFIPMSDGSTWTPRNYSGEYEGEMSIREGLRRSKNMIAIRLGREVGVNAVRSVAKRAGIKTPVPGYPSVFIGSAEVYPLELISSYAAFGNGGVHVEPHFISRIEDGQGRTLWQPAYQPQMVFKPAVSYILTDMLREVVDRGTGYNVRNPAVGNLPYSVPAAGKTGTTNDATDVWFVGYTPDVLVGVWLGFDQPKQIMRGATGGGLATPVWAQVVRKYYETHEVSPEWARPQDVVMRNISRWTGTAVSDDCPYIVGSYADMFVADAAPEPGCEPPTLYIDPNPELPGRPLFPGQPRVPQPVEVPPVRPPA